MFTGLISDVGEILAVEQRGDLRVRIACSYDIKGMPMGASVACDGICLTVVDKGAVPRAWFEVDVSEETVTRSAVGEGAWAVGRRVNLERSLRVGDELGGHIVSGHVDGVARVVEQRDEGGSTRYLIEAPAPLSRFIAAKGSVALTGTSLTVNEIADTRFGVNLIPHTKAVTTWGDVETGSALNLEVDTMARYVARLSEAG